MKKCTSSFDRFSDLPSNITESILMLLPMRDLARTSILSKKWRFRWVQVPRLIFEDDSKMFRSSDTMADYLNIVVGILFQHDGPIRKLKLDMSTWCTCYGIDKIFQFLSRNGIQELKLLMPRGDLHMPPRAPSMPPSIYSCVELTHLSLKYCSLKPLKLDGFRKLVTLDLLYVKLDPHVTICDCPYLRYLILQPLPWVTLLRIDCPNLESLVIKRSVTCVCIKKAPLLKVLALLSPLKFLLEKDIKLIEFLSSFPLLENLTMSSYSETMPLYSPNKLPTMLNKLQILRLIDIDLNAKDRLSSFLRLIRSSSNLQKLEFSESWGPYPFQLPINLQQPNPCHYSLMKLREVKFELKNDPRNYFDFFEFLLSIAPELETLYIKPASCHIDLSCCKTLLNFVCTRRASSKADIIFIGLDD